jgi:hypothetical protein
MLLGVSHDGLDDEPATQLILLDLCIAQLDAFLVHLLDHTLLVLVLDLDTPTYSLCINYHGSWEHRSKVSRYRPGTTHGPRVNPKVCRRFFLEPWHLGSWVDLTEFEKDVTASEYF